MVENVNLVKVKKVVSLTANFAKQAQTPLITWKITVSLAPIGTVCTVGVPREQRTEKAYCQISA